MTEETATYQTPADALTAEVMDGMRKSRARHRKTTAEHKEIVRRITDTGLLFVASANMWKRRAIIGAPIAFAIGLALGSAFL